MRIARIFACVLCSCPIWAGCGGDGGHHGSGDTANVSPGGIGKGTDSQTGLTIQGPVAEDGRFHFIRADGTQYVGTVTTTGTCGSGSIDGFARVGTTFAGGSSHGTGTISGTIQQRRSFVATTQFTTDSGTAFSDSLSLTFKTVYSQPSSLATISGNYVDATTGAVVPVDGNGVIFAQDAPTSAVRNGTVTLIDASDNAYGVSIS